MMNAEQYAQVQIWFLKLGELEPHRWQQELDRGIDLNQQQTELLLRLLKTKVDDNFLEPASDHLFQSAFKLIEKENATIVSEIPLAGGSTVSLDARFENKRIGNYKLLQKIGEGGHGIVYMAEQSKPIQRRVAIKVIKPGMQSKAILARFEAERQALAMMKHPSIANVLDAGSDDNGLPFFVMDLVRGIPIDQFCNENQTSLEQTLSLFTQLCEAIHHAHRRGIIHRDIKPANVLITVDSGKPLPKVIDFGIAKAMHLSLTDRTLFTEYGQIVGTLEYMSPEQATMSQNEVDVRSDVYSLGVLLYVLLTGSPPFSKDRLLRDGVFGIGNVFETVHPPTPSLRLTEMKSPARWKDRANLESNRWLVNLRSDLDWITMKAIAVDPARRYDSAAEFAKDVSNFLDGKSVLARPPSWTYRSQKWIRRHKVATTVTVALFGALLISLCGIVWGYLAAKQNVSDLQVAKQRVEEQAGELQAALLTTESERERADQNANRLAETLRRQILENAWDDLMDGDVASVSEQLGQLQSVPNDYTRRFVEKIGAQTDWESLRDDSAGPIRLLVGHRKLGLVGVVTTASTLEIWDVLERKKSKQVQLPTDIYDLISFSKDGSTVLLGLSGGRLQWVEWKTESFSQIITHGKGGNRCAVEETTPKNWLVTTGANYLLGVDFENQTVKSIKKFSDRLGALCLLPDGNQICISTTQGDVFLTDHEASFTSRASGNEKPLESIRIEGKHIHALDASGRVQYLSIAKSSDESTTTHDLKAKDPSTIVFDAARNKTIRSVKDLTEFDELSVVESGTEDSVFFVDKHGTVAVTSENLVVPVRRFSEEVRQLVYFEQPSVLLVRHSSGRINLVDGQDINCRRNYVKRLANVSAGCVLKLRHESVTGHNDGTIFRWDTQTGEPLAQRKVHGGSVWSIVVNEKWERMVSLGDDFQLVISALNRFDNATVIPIGLGVRSIAMAHAGDQVLGPPNARDETRFPEGTFVCRELPTGKITKHFIGHQNWVTQLQFDANDQSVFSLGLDGYFRVWDIKTAECRLAIDLRSSANANVFAVLEERREVVFGHDDGSIQIYDLVSGKSLRSQLILKEAVENLLVVPGNDIIFVCDANDSLLTLVDPLALNIEARVSTTVGKIKGIAMDPSHSRLLMLGLQGEARIWDLPSGLHSGNVEGVSFEAVSE